MISIREALWERIIFLHLFSLLFCLFFFFGFFFFFFCFGFFVFVGFFCAVLRKFSSTLCFPPLFLAGVSLRGIVSRREGYEDFPGLASSSFPLPSIFLVVP